MKDNDKTNSTQAGDSHDEKNKTESELLKEGILSARSILQDYETLSYDEMLNRFETLLQRAETLRACDQRQVAEGLLAGAEELLLRQDEIGGDFTIAIIALNEQASQQILAVIHKNE